MANKIVLNWSPPVHVNIPSPAHSILKSWLEKNNYEVIVLYWNLYFYSLQGDFIFQSQKAHDVQNDMLLYLNYIAFRNNDRSIYNEIKSILQSINPSYVSTDDGFYDRHMESAYRETDRIIEELFATIDFSQILYWGFALKMDQWLFASILAQKIKEKDPTMPVVVGGINTKDVALTYLKKFSQFDYATWGEGEGPLLELTRFLENTNGHCDIQEVSNVAYRRGDEVLFSNKRNRYYLDMADLVLFPDFSDYFKTKDKLKIGCPSYITIEGSRGCHWNRCHFCYLNTDYRYRLKSVDKIRLEIQYMIDTYGIYDFEFLDNDLVGKDIARFNSLLDCFIEIKKEFPRFQIVLAEIITKDLDYATIKKMFDAGIKYAQIGYESASSGLLKKIDKKNTFSSNLLYVKFAVFHKIPLGGVNVITGLLEETTEDIIEACANLRFLRFYLDYKMFRHATLPLTVNSSSRYYNKINQSDSAWRLFKIPHILLRNSFSREEQWRLFEFVRVTDNIHWNCFLKIESYYLSHKHTYKIENIKNLIVLKEFINNKIAKTLSWDVNSLEAEILYKTDEKPRHFDDLHSELVCLYTNQNRPIPSDGALRNALDTLYQEGIVYFDKISDDNTDLIRYDNIISVIVLRKS
ncbi:MAG: hypothetical protein IKV62_03015 [Bacteroidales bacterium]|nr:hypothetical protein [Bacteroidales bacterium]